MKYFKNVVTSLATIVLIVLILQITWNVFAPLFGGPVMNVIEMGSAFVFIFIGVTCVSVIWNSQPSVQQVFHYGPSPKDNLPEGQ